MLCGYPLRYTVSWLLLTLPNPLLNSSWTSALLLGGFSFPSSSSSSSSPSVASTLASTANETLCSCALTSGSECCRLLIVPTSSASCSAPLAPLECLGRSSISCTLPSHWRSPFVVPWRGRPPLASAWSTSLLWVESMQAACSNLFLIARSFSSSRKQSASLGSHLHISESTWLLWGKSLGL